MEDLNSLIIIITELIIIILLVLLLLNKVPNNKSFKIFKKEILLNDNDLDIKDYFKYCRKLGLLMGFKLREIDEVFIENKTRYTNDDFIEMGFKKNLLNGEKFFYTKNINKNDLKIKLKSTTFDKDSLYGSILIQ